MKRFKRKEKALILGIAMIVIGLFLRSFAVHIDNNIIINIMAILSLSVGMGFSIAAFFSNTMICMSDVRKYMLVPLSISLVILVFKKFEIQMPLLQIGLLFFINIMFFMKEIKKALKNQ